MPITVICSQCQQALSVGEEHAGKRGKCPKCQTIIPIPAAGVAHIDRGPMASAATKSAAVSARQSASTAPRAAVPRVMPATKSGPPSPDQLRAKVMRGFQAEHIDRISVSPLYQVGILLTTLLMVLLPLIYVAIIGLVCLLVWWHLTHSHVIFSSVRGRGAILALIIYVAPLVIGAIVIVFMFKPLFAPPAAEGRRRSATPQSDPLLFEFVQRICALVGAPVPRRIDIDCNINASASYRRGWLSLLSGRDLVLTIGLPLAAGLTLQQLAGVLAHEFGHFSQRAGMRLTYIIRSINFWFVRVVYQRDAWDEWLESAADGMDIRIAWVIYVARACVWVTRRILWLLMYAGHAVAGFMLRQMEFDADRYEARVAGSDAFESTCRRLHLLGLAWHNAQADLASFHREGRLVDDLPKLMLANLKQMPKEAHDFVGKMIAESKTGVFDDHPSDQQRIAAARSLTAAGVFHSDLPARVLFGNFDATSKGVTWDYYCSIFGKLVDPKSLHSTDQLLARTESDQAASKARDRFFAGAFSFLRPLRLPILQADKTQHASVWQAEINQTRQVMESQAESCRDLLASFDKSDTRLVQSRQARSVLSTGVALQANRFDATYRSTADATQQRDSALTELSRIGNRLETFEDAVGRRLRADFMLLFEPAVARRLEAADQMQQEARQLWPLVSQISSVHGSILELRNANATQAALLGHFGGNERNEPLAREILDYAARVRTQIADLKATFERVDYPFDHAAGQIPVSHYLIKVVPPAEEIGAIHEAAEEMVNKLMEMYGRAVSRLCVIAEAVESDQGFSPLPMPPEAAR